MEERIRKVTVENESCENVNKIRSKIWPSKRKLLSSFFIWFATCLKKTAVYSVVRSYAMSNFCIGLCFVTEALGNLEMACMFIINYVTFNNFQTLFS